MLTFEIAGSDLDKDWQASTEGLICGDSWIRPFCHPMLESFTLRSPQRTALVVRERGRRGMQKNYDLNAAQFDLALRRAYSWPLQYTVIVIDKKRAGVSVRQGLWGTAPVYLVEKHDFLYGNWDPLVLYPLLDRVDLVRAARFLYAFDMPYGHRTLFAELRLLTANTLATWAAGESLEIEYPAARPKPRVRKLKADARPAQAALHILDSSVQRWIHDDVIYGSELSGGLDSSLVSIVVRKHLPVLKTFGINLEDAQGQNVRRGDLIERFGFHDMTVDLDTLQPLSPTSPRWFDCPSVPWEETYEEAVCELLRHASEQGVQAMFTGFGGDELCPLYSFEAPPPPEMATLEPASEEISSPEFLVPAVLEHLASQSPDAAPQADIDASSLESAAYGSALYLRHGIWPIFPLCTPELVSFSSALPWSWRVGRTIEREMLRNVDSPDSVSDCRTVDSFLESLASGFRTNSKAKLMQLFKTPLIAELGLVNERHLQEAFQNWCEGGADEAVVSFYAAASLELALRHVGGPI